MCCVIRTARERLVEDRERCVGERERIMGERERLMGEKERRMAEKGLEQVYNIQLLSNVLKLEALLELLSFDCEGSMEKLP
jgi:hypothetical protein